MLRLSKDLKEFKRRKNIARISGIILVIATILILILTYYLKLKLLKCQKIDWHIFAYAIYIGCATTILVFLEATHSFVVDYYKNIIRWEIKHKKVYTELVYYVFQNTPIDLEEMDNTRICFKERKFIINLCNNLIKLLEDELIEVEESEKQKIIIMASAIAATLIKTPIIRKSNNQLNRLIDRIVYFDDSEIQKNKKILEAVIYEYLSKFPDYIDAKKLNFFYRNDCLLLLEAIFLSDDWIKDIYKKLTKLL